MNAVRINAHLKALYETAHARQGVLIALLNEWDAADEEHRPEIEAKIADARRDAQSARRDIERLHGDMRSLPKSIVSAIALVTWWPVLDLMQRAAPMIGGDD